MEGTSLRKLVLSIVIVMMMMVELTKAELHYVGGNKAGWTPNTNFSEWTSHEKFLVGDWLCMLSLSLSLSMSFCMNCLGDEKVLGRSGYHILIVGLACSLFLLFFLLS